MSRHPRALALLASIALSIPQPPTSQGPNPKARQLKIPGGAEAPSFSIDITADGRKGVVIVRDEKGLQTQTLVCPLLRDNPEPTEPELAAVREQFVSQLVVADLDSDGHPDLAGIREFGAKWARYCVWLYDPKQRLFVKDFLAEQMELLTNLTSSGGGRLSSSHLGPVNPWLAVYRIAKADLSRPERQLIPEFSCLLESDSHGQNATITIARYDKGAPVVQRRPIANSDASSAFSKCSSGAFQ